MKIEKSSDILKTRDELFNTILNDGLDDINQIVDEIKTNKDITESEYYTVIDWGDDKELENKSDEELKLIKETRDFIQNTFNEYQLRSLQLLTEQQKLIESETFENDTEKNNVLLQNMQNSASSLIISMFIKCVNWSNRNACDYTTTHYKSYIDELEDLYFNTKTENTKLTNENTDLKEEIERLKNKKFLGLFKVN